MLEHAGRASTFLAQPAALLGGVGRRVLRATAAVGHATLFLGRTAAALVQPPYRGLAALEQVQFIGNRSLLIVSLTSSFTGLVLTLQGYNALQRFGAERMVGALVALSLVRELAPVLAALMITARAGSAMAATIGNMRVSEQIDALITMAIDPISFVVVPRVCACLISVPLLTAVFTVAGLAVGRFFGVAVIGLDGGTFDASVRDAIEWSDVVEGVTKACLFSLLLAWISTYRGFYASGGAKGVGQATTQAVVETSVLILALDYVLTALLF
jgi:phospholipid/cholesterol/gamma-HCH transport system permease protein